MNWDSHCSKVNYFHVKVNLLHLQQHVLYRSLLCSFHQSLPKAAKKAETSKQICKTDRYLGFSGNRPSQCCWIFVALCGLGHGYKTNPDSIPPPPAAGATLRLQCVHHRGGGECHGGGDRGCSGQQVGAGVSKDNRIGLENLTLKFSFNYV